MKFSIEKQKIVDIIFKETIEKHSSLVICHWEPSMTTSEIL